GARTRRWTSALIAGELALTLALLAGAGFMIRSFLMFYRMDIGADTSHLLMMQLPLASGKYPTVESRNRFLEQVNARLGGISSIDAPTPGGRVPLGGGPTRYTHLNDRPDPAGVPLPTVTMVTVGPRYWETIKVPIARGRALTEADGLPGHEAV